MSISSNMRKPIYPVGIQNLPDVQETMEETYWRITGPFLMARTGGLAGWQISRVRAFIEGHLAEPIKVKNLSAVVRLSASYFSQAFKKSFGSAPHAYLIQRRLDRARHLMLTSEARLSEIALACGFHDQAHLCRLFHQSTDQSPAAWRHEHREAAQVDRLVLLQRSRKRSTS